MFKKLTIASQFQWIFLGAFLTLGVGIESKPAIAGCNFHGCSQSSVAECNFHGCPNPPMGAECNFHGCPPSPQPPQQQQQQQQQQPVQQVPVVYPPYPYPPYPNVGGSPQGIQQCMNSLLYRQELVCTRASGCSGIPKEGIGGWEYRSVRTQTSDTAAAQACQNAR
jgi:hypothetical protein